MAFTHITGLPVNGLLLLKGGVDTTMLLFLFSWIGDKGKLFV